MEVAVLSNGSYMCTKNSLEEAIELFSKWYKKTAWQEKVDNLEVRDIVTEPNGFKHVGCNVLYSTKSSFFWN